MRFIKFLFLLFVVFACGEVYHEQPNDNLDQLKAHEYGSAHDFTMDYIKDNLELKLKSGLTVNESIHELSLVALKMKG
jgi:hypothetical protein